MEQTIDPAASRRARLRITFAVVAVALVFGISQCGKDRSAGQVANEALQKGLAAHKEGKTAEARAHYLDVIKLDVGNKFANFNLGVLEQRRGRQSAAEQYYRRALVSDPNFQPALFNLAVLLEGAGEDQEAAATYRRLLEINPRHATAHLNLGFLLIRKLNQPDQGRLELQKAVELDPKLAGRVPRGSVR